MNNIIINDDEYMDCWVVYYDAQKSIYLGL